MNEEDLLKAVTNAKKLLEKHHSLLFEYTSYVDTLTIPGHYVLYWELVTWKPLHIKKGAKRFMLVGIEDKNAHYCTLFQT